ncbi:hypothetical protein Tco_0344862 [Tanacetum coccineum]
METKDTLSSCSDLEEQQMQQMQDKSKESYMGKVDTSKALNASLVDTKSSGTESGEQDTSSSSGNDADADDADIKPVYDEEPMAEWSLIIMLELVPSCLMALWICDLLAPSQSELFLYSYFTPFFIPKDYYTILLNIPGQIPQVLAGSWE